MPHYSGIAISKACILFEEIIWMNDLNGKVIIITGASGGIGEAAARAFDRAGSRIVLVSRREDKLKEIALKLKDALVIPADLSDEGQARGMIEKTIDHYGRLDILMNNAANIMVVNAENVSTEDFLKAFMTNLCGPALATRLAFAQMEAQESGHIINIGSPGFMLGIPFYAPYVCSKAAFSAWTRTIQAEWADSCVKISEYFPGYIRTDSKPESRLGDINQDFLMEEKQNFIARHFTKPQSPEQVAKQLVRLAIRPRALMCSSFQVRLGAFISNFPSFRINIASQMAKTARSKMKINQNP